MTKKISIVGFLLIPLLFSTISPALAAGTSTIHIFVGGYPIATVETSETGESSVFYNHSDHLRSTSLVTDLEGAVVEKVSYDPLGKITDQVGAHREQRKFTSHEFDPSTNYTYAESRYLDTEFGRFLSQDSASLAVGDAKLLQLTTGISQGEYLLNPQLHNSYSYATNNPINLVDPDGKLAKEWMAVFRGDPAARNALGTRVDQLANQSPLFNAALEHPYIAGATIGVVGGGVAVGASAVSTAVSIQSLGGIGTACMAFCSQTDKAIRLIKNTQNVLSAAQRDSISGTIGNSKLQNIFSDLYQGSDKLPGGTAGAINYTIDTGALVQGSTHIIKGEIYLRGLQNVLQNPNLSSGDRLIAQTLSKQLTNALSKLIK